MLTPENGGSSTMRKLTLILLCLSLTSCSFQAADNIASRLKAVYLVHGQGELASGDLQAHPEVAVVQTFDEFKQYTNQKIAFWIDKSATPFNSEEEKWINEAPQTYYPIVMVGTSDTLYGFSELLKLHGFTGIVGDYPGYAAPGFSVIQWEAKDNLGFHALILNGYNQKPTVQAILEITNGLLEGKLKPAPTLPFVPVATATR